MEFEDRDRVQRWQSELVNSTMIEKFQEPYLEYRRRWESAGEHLFAKSAIGNSVLYKSPVQLDIGLTSYCNLKCKMCYHSFVPESK